MNNPIIISTAAYDGYDLTVAFREIAETGVDLVEVAFISNPDEERKLQTENFQNSVAEAIYTGLSKYLERSVDR